MVIRFSGAGGTGAPTVIYRENITTPSVYIGQGETTAVADFKKPLEASAAFLVSDGEITFQTEGNYSLDVHMTFGTRTVDLPTSQLEARVVLEKENASGGWEEVPNAEARWLLEGQQFKLNQSTYTEDAELSTSDVVALVDASAGAVTITLPGAASNSDRIFHVKKIDTSANAVTIDGQDAETIDDSATRVLSFQYDAVRIISDGTEWWIL